MVHRARLLGKLEAVLESKLTVVAAPAGFGKTALLTEWVTQSDLLVGWVSLDEGDNDPALFWTYFISVLQNLEPRIGKTAFSSLQSPQPPPIDAILGGLINDIADYSKPLIVVLDDCHVISNQAVWEALTFLLDHLPEQMHLAIATRADPPLPLARLRARNQLTEIRAADLRFTTEETAALFNENLGLGLTEGDITSLVARTEGWVASLRMAGISLKDCRDKPRFVENFSGSHRFVLDYLTSEVLSRQDKATHDFLLNTSILKRLSGPLCDAVTGTSGSQRVLEHLEEANLFVEPLDEVRQWYRYHQLFAELLQAQLAKTDPELEIPLHLRASDWFEQAGFQEEAIFHALAGKDYERAAILVEKIAEGLLSLSRIATLQRLVNALPAEVVKKRHWLGICQAWVLLLSGQFEQLVTVLSAVEKMEPKKEPDDYHKRVRGHAMVIRGYLARAHGDTGHALQLAQEAVELLPPDDLAARSANALNLGIVLFMTGNVKEAAKYFEESSKAGIAGNNSYVAVESLCSLGDTLVEQGQLHRAYETYQQAVELGARFGCGQPLPAAGHAYYGLGKLDYEWNNLEHARQNVLTVIKLAESGQLPTSYDYAMLAQIEQARDRPEEAARALEKIDTSSLAGTLDEIHVSSRKARVLQAQGHGAALERWARSVEASLKTTTVPEYSLELPYLTLLNVKTALGVTEHIKESLETLSQKAEKQARLRSVIEIRAVRALALMTSGDAEEAVSELDKALQLARPEKYIRIFVDLGPMMHQLLRQTLRASREKDYVNAILDAFPKPGTQSTPIASPETRITEHLNEREIAILRNMADGLSNSQIAAKLFLSPNTVKWYVRNLYGKLGANNRVEAVNQARKLNLL